MEMKDKNGEICGIPVNNKAIIRSIYVPAV